MRAEREIKKKQNYCAEISESNKDTDTEDADNKDRKMGKREMLMEN